jgi:membrane-bound inhibitor of C-type lysozyme
MNKKALLIAISIGLALNSCNKKIKKEAITNETSVTTDEIEDIVTSISTDKAGKKLDMIFNNTKNTATISFNGDTIVLLGQNPASGIWYKNEIYELRGQGEQVELTKNGVSIFISGEDIQPKNTDVVVEKKSTWWLGKQFVNNRPVSKNPEEGGADFLNINKDKTVAYKVGDIVETMTLEEKEDKIILRNTLTGRTIKFKVNTNYLVDEFGTRWISKE